MHSFCQWKKVHSNRIPSVKGNSHKRKLTHKKVFVENHFLDAHVCKYFMALTKAELVGSSSPFLSFFPKPSLLVQSANWTHCEWHKVAAGNDDWTLKLSSAQTDSTLSLLLSLTPAVALTLLSLSSLSLSRIQLELEISSGLCEFCLLLSLCECVSVVAPQRIHKLQIQFKVNALCLSTTDSNKRHVFLPLQRVY